MILVHCKSTIQTPVARPSTPECTHHKPHNSPLIKMALPTITKTTPITSKSRQINTHTNPNSNSINTIHLPQTKVNKSTTPISANPISLKYKILITTRTIISKMFNKFEYKLFMRRRLYIILELTHRMALKIADSSKNSKCLKLL